jgi:lactate dehydrogenase-like 2-hydroxyacid dehydrogenase
MAIGTDMIDLDACKAHGVTVSNVPAASNEAVAEHAIALYFAVRRNVVQMHEMTMQGEEGVSSVFGADCHRHVGRRLWVFLGVGN